ncbi:GNAT family N-acetyltransferase [Lactiplantibacillus garii]|uniref:GNAT family N-acetyltransferase n=1 Tax=Lactiplantibacillus garii TaxID=2306423 RepID=A0A426D5R4_9LACO|nr:GNAT family N-acetyltransferase [Lactiplantibacillus garii]RRK09986.1 GNAT family N-acetyltransferase [Lactiplantibacillus garii]
MLIAQPATTQDYPQLVDLWQASVAGSHDFLSAADQRALATELPGYFDQVELVKWSDETALIGFSGRVGDELVMLFLAPHVFGHGYGHQIITQLDQQAPLRRVDVNEQNHAARQFYARQGFTVARRDPLDGAGRPYPILHLVR